MTMIPILLSALMPAPSITSAPTPASVPVAAGAGGRNGYRPGGAHRPAAATLAIGLPAVLVVAVALSPMVMTKAPRIDDPVVTSIPLTRPDVPPPPKAPDTLPPPPHPGLVDPQINIPDLDPPIITPPIEYRPPIISEWPGNVDPPVQIPAAPKLVAATADPRFASLFQPDYPAFEQRNAVEGVVEVRVLIGTDGRVKAVEQLGSASPGFFAETRRRALAKWRFKPATRDGVPYESWKTMTVRFELRSA